MLIACRREVPRKEWEIFFCGATEMEESDAIALGDVEATLDKVGNEPGA